MRRWRPVAGRTSVRGMMANIAVLLMLAYATPVLVVALGLGVEEALEAS